MPLGPEPDDPLPIRSVRRCPTEPRSFCPRPTHAAPNFQVPLLSIDGLELVQTQAILRYLASKKGLSGAAPADAARADMVVNGIFDARMGLITARFSDQPEAALAKFASVTLPRLAAHLEKLLATHEGPYVCAGGLTYADIVLLECLCYAEDECEPSLEELLRGCPRVLAHHRRMRAFPHVEDYLCSDRRKPPPDAAFVRTTCAILGIKCPAYARPLEDQLMWPPLATMAAEGARALQQQCVGLRGPRGSSRRVAALERGIVVALIGSVAMGALTWRLSRK